MRNPNETTHETRRAGARREGQLGLVALEMALVLPALMVLFLFLVEGANAMRVYAVIQDASREGARQVLRDGDTGGVTALVASLTGDLPESELNTSIVMAPGGGAVTVEVQYAYQSFYGFDALLDVLSDTPLVLKASTTMPLP